MILMEKKSYETASASNRRWDFPYMYEVLIHSYIGPLDIYMYFPLS